LANSICRAGFTPAFRFLPLLRGKWRQRWQNYPTGFWSRGWRAALLILDEQPARRLATSLGLRVIGTVGLLMAGKQRGFLAKIKPELDRLRAVRFFMDRDLY
jgi:hypothetical protein